MGMLFALKRTGMRRFPESCERGCGRETEIFERERRERKEAKRVERAGRKSAAGDKKTEEAG